MDTARAWVPAKRSSRHDGKDRNLVQMQSDAVLCGSPKHRKPGAGLLTAQGSFVEPNPWRPGLASRFCAGAPPRQAHPSSFQPKPLGRAQICLGFNGRDQILAESVPILRGSLLWTGPGCVHCENSNIISFVFNLLALSGFYRWP